MQIYKFGRGFPESQFLSPGVFIRDFKFVLDDEHLQQMIEEYQRLIERVRRTEEMANQVLGGGEMMSYESALTMIVGRRNH